MFRETVTYRVRNVGIFGMRNLACMRRLANTQRVYETLYQKAPIICKMHPDKENQETFRIIIACFTKGSWRGPKP